MSSSRAHWGRREGLTRDDVLDNVTLKWLTNAAGSSFRTTLLGEQVRFLLRCFQGHCDPVAVSIVPRASSYPAPKNRVKSTSSEAHAQLTIGYAKDRQLRGLGTARRAFRGRSACRIRDSAVSRRLSGGARCSHRAPYVTFVLRRGCRCAADLLENVDRRRLLRKGEDQPRSSRRPVRCPACRDSPQIERLGTTESAVRARKCHSLDRFRVTVARERSRARSSSFKFWTFDCVELDSHASVRPRMGTGLAEGQAGGDRRPHAPSSNFERHLRQRQRRRRT